MRFSWDARKEVANFREHRVSFVEARSAFADPISVCIPDPNHSFGEMRMLLVGLTSHHRLLVVAYVEYHEDDFRIISARLATQTERLTYEEERP